MGAVKSILLINPPVAKPGEAPAGIAKLARALKNSGISCTVFDANIEGLLYLLKKPYKGNDTWSRRAVKNLTVNLDAFKSLKTFSNMDRYKRVVIDINRVLSLAGRSAEVMLSLSNYGDTKRSPIRSRDLLEAAENHETNPFYLFFKHRLEELLMKIRPDIIGLSVNFMSQAICAFAMAGFIKKHFPKIKIVAGGGLITSWINIPGFSNPFKGLVDNLFSGPGEQALLALCGKECHEKPSLSDFDYSEFKFSRYLSPGVILPHITAMGCYWQKCAFCPEKSEKSGYHPVELKKFSDDLLYQVKESNPRLIHFLDNAISPRFLKHLIENPPGTPWYGFVRITKHLADPDFIRGLKASGCIMLKLGVESGDQNVLDHLNKGTNLETTSTVLKTLKKEGIATYIYLLFGTPPEDLNAARKTLTFTRRHAGAINFLNLAIFNLPAYSEEAKKLDTLSFYDGDLSLYREFKHPLGWDRNIVRHFLSKEFTKDVSIKKIMTNDPPYFTSNHAPLLVMNQQ
ncbi:MAG: radical SAM protein [Desulfobacterales bacterium]|nr:radical SAM protein [Desulfobacterales bacterium]